jgi:hypothetical protein
MRVIRFAVGVAVGYVLGTRAGRERYEQIVEQARKVAGSPPVAAAQDRVTEMIDKGKEQVTRRIADDDNVPATTA